ncbi:MAG: 23S rRNA pseudouridine(1911/1915/1917) synthase RluD [Thiotrichales bacterium]|nr:MAG: 23S rRNA pseudouridine(1911/1915/1917) synthase RluD [Thiotrichales bacterium]
MQNQSNEEARDVLEIAEQYAGWRIDKVLAELLPEHSRANLQKWLKAEKILLNGKPAAAKYKVSTGQIINIVEIPEAHNNVDMPQDIAIDVVYDDADVIVVDKPVGMVMHPGTGNHDKTLLNALLYKFPELSKLPRAGIVHRLDKDTSGLLVVARSLVAHTDLVRQLQQRSMERIYETIVYGSMISGKTINLPIGRHATQRVKMAVMQNGRSATTHIRVIERYKQHTLLRIKLETGRTHQIRVHLSHIGYPIIGDHTYTKLRLPKGATSEVIQEFRNIGHQLLHAKSLQFTHPSTGELMSFNSELPQEMQKFKELLRAC